MSDFHTEKADLLKRKNKDTKIERMSLSVLEEEKNLARNNPSKLEETSLTENLANVQIKKLISKDYYAT